jgi:hypothetical protein
VGVGEMEKQITQNSSFQGTMSQFQSFFTYLESIIPNGGSNSGTLPSGWNTGVGASKLQNLYSGFMNLFYGNSQNPTWSQMSFTIWNSATSSFIQVPFEQGGVVQPSIMKILTAFNAYFSTTTGMPPIVSTPLNPSAHVPDVLMLLFTTMQAKFGNNPIPNSGGGDNGYDFAAAFGIENSDGTITGSSFGVADASIGAANNFWLQIQETTQEGNNPGQSMGEALYLAASGQSDQAFIEVVIPAMASEYSSDSSNPTSDGSLLDNINNSAGTAQSEAYNESQETLTALQTVGQNITTETQTGQSIASNEASSETEMVSNQTPV